MRTTQNTDGQTPVPALLEDLSTFPAEDSLEGRYETALLMVHVLLEAMPHLDRAAWRRRLRAGAN